MKIHIYLFTYIFIYNEKHIYNIDGVRGVRGLAGSSGFGVRGFFPPPSFRLHLSLRGGFNSAHALLNTGLEFCTFCCHFDGCFRSCVAFVIGLLRHFFYPILDPPAFVPNTFYTQNLSKYCLFQSLSQYGLFQNPGLHTCFGLNVRRGLNKTNVFASKASHKELF